MKSIPKLRRAFFPALGLCLALLPLLQAAPSADEKKWIKEVVLGPEFGGAGKIVSLWTRKPKLSIMESQNAQFDAVLGKCVTELNATLVRTPLGGVQMERSGAASADILVYHVPLSRFDRIARQHKFKYEPNNYGYFWTFWNDRNEIYKAVVLISSDKLTGNFLHHFTLEELTQSLGLSNDSRIFEDSIFYGGQSEVISHSAADKRLIEFAYRRLRPGMTAREVDAAIASGYP
ncbi:MAG: DUF2927 domain-containing protein [Verrucomicrobiae bacterium]|nr:DUF2927 domain-containing protein [Verrucomicrobiae bacterium]